MAVRPNHCNSAAVAATLPMISIDGGASFCVTASRCMCSTVEVITRYSWPGHVRELENLMERWVVLVPRDRVEADDLPALVRAAGSLPSHPASPLPPAGERLSDIERARILDVLGSCEGNKKLAASLLGIHRSTLYAKLARYGMR